MGSIIPPLLGAGASREYDLSANLKMQDPAAGAKGKLSSARPEVLESATDSSGLGRAALTPPPLLIFQQLPPLRWFDPKSWKCLCYC
jgi:hypothetical protein